MIANAAEVKRSKFFSNSRRGIVQIKRGGNGYSGIRGSLIALAPRCLTVL